MNHFWAILGRLLGYISRNIRFCASGRFYDASTEATPNRSRSQPTLAVEPACHAKLHAYVQECDAEIAGFGAVRVNADRTTLVLDDVFILPQRVTRASVDIDAEDVADFLTDYVAESGDVNTLRCFWHSHADMAAYMSSIDINTMTHGLADAPWFVSLVINKAGAMRASLIIHEPVLVWLDDIPVGVYIAPEVREEVRAEIQQKVRRGWPAQYYGDARRHEHNDGRQGPRYDGGCASVTPVTPNDGRDLYTYYDRDNEMEAGDARDDTPK